MTSRFRDRLQEVRSSPLVLAHRGDSFHAPENTLEAARLGREAGADAWELDVQLTRDGVAVVLHDESLCRTTDVERRFSRDPRRLSGFQVSDFDWPELQSLDAGSWFLSGSGGFRTAAAFGTLERISAARRTHYESGQVGVPTLRDALLLTRDLDWLVNVELKSFPESPPALLEAVLDLIAETGTADRVLLSSFDHGEIARLGELALTARSGVGGIPRGILVWTPLHRPFEYLTRSVRADAYHVSAPALGSESIAYRREPAARNLRGSEIAELRDRGIPVLVYTVNDCRPGGLAVHLAELGVSGVFSDDPAGLSRQFSSASG
jgi:glycerophosphoryl diester phosphodiesterase